MAQNDVFNWFRTRYLTGETRFFLVCEVVKGVKEKGFNGKNVDKQIQKLYAFGYLDIKLDGTRRTYRIKKKYLTLREEPKSPFKRDYI